MAERFGDAALFERATDSYANIDAAHAADVAELLGTDLAKDEYRAINEYGSDYDDDVGGAAYVGGRGGVELDPIDADQDARARQAALTLYRSIETSRDD